MSLQILRKTAAIRLFDSGSVHVSLAHTRRLKVHDDFPDAPESPFYLSLRAEGVKDGHLTPNDFAAIGEATAAKAREAGLLFQRSFVGIPQAGEPLADVFFGALTANEASMLKRKHLSKVVQPDGTRKIGGFVGVVNLNDIQNLLVLDDLMSNADTKRETSERIVEAGGRMSDLLLFMNRSKTGVADLASLGIQTHVVWEFKELMRFYLETGRISGQESKAIMSYPDQLADYIAANS